MARAASGERLTPLDSCASASRCVSLAPAPVEGPRPGSRSLGAAPARPAAEVDVGPEEPTCGVPIPREVHEGPAPTPHACMSQACSEGQQQGPEGVCGGPGREVVPFLLTSTKRVLVCVCENEEVQGF